MENTISPFSIYAESTPNPSSMKFVANRYLIPNERTFEYNLESNTDDAPFAARLLQFPFITNVFIAKNFVTLTKIEALEWQDVIHELRVFIGEYLNKGGKIVKVETKEDPADQEKEESFAANHSEPKNEIEEKIIQALDEYIRPAVESDGGAIVFDSFNEGQVNVILKGSCSGCPSSTMTLKSGIENLLKQMMPEDIKTVEAING